MEGVVKDGLDKWERAVVKVEILWNFHNTPPYLIVRGDRIVKSRGHSRDDSYIIIVRDG